jgi:hypothetical protein
MLAALCDFLRFVARRPVKEALATGRRGKEAAQLQSDLDVQEGSTADALRKEMGDFGR